MLVHPRVKTASALSGSALLWLGWMFSPGQIASAELDLNQCPCPTGSVGVLTTIEVQNITISQSDLEETISQVLLYAPSLVKSSKSLRLNQLDAKVRIEVLACSPRPDPKEAYALVSEIQPVIGAGSLAWSAAVDPQCSLKDQDLQLYFDMLSTLSEHKELVASRASNFSEAAIWRIGNSTSLMLNNLVMSDTRDEHIYHEVLVHPALLAAEQPRRVLIIGGGEGATLREVLRDGRIEHVTMVDIDKGLVELCQQHLPMMHQGSFYSPKVTLVFEDGEQFLKGLQSESFDVVIVDGIDYGEEQAASYGNNLFGQLFYIDIFRVLRMGGTFVQYLSDVEKIEVAELLWDVGFDNFQYMCEDVASFHGEGACFALAGKALTETFSKRVEQRVIEFEPEGGWAHLSREVVSRCFTYMARRLKSSGRGSSGSSSSGSGSKPGYRGTGGVVVGGGAVGGPSHGYRRRRGQKEEECHVLLKDHPQCKEDSFDEVKCNDANKAEYNRNKACYDCKDDACLKSICEKENPDNEWAENEACPKWNSCCECYKKMQDNLKCDCFPASAMVMTLKGEVPIDSLQRSDKLWSPPRKIGRLVEAHHMVDAHDPDVGHETRLVEFVEIHHHLMPPNRPLLITPGHFLYKADERGYFLFSRADEIRTGDYVVAVVDEKVERSRVIHASRRQAVGAFSPQTTSGRLIVNGVAVSSFAVTSDTIDWLWKIAPWARSYIENLYWIMLFPTRLFYEANWPFTGQVDLLRLHLTSPFAADKKIQVDASYVV